MPRQPPLPPLAALPPPPRGGYSTRMPCTQPPHTPPVGRGVPPSTADPPPWRERGIVHGKSDLRETCLDGEAAGGGEGGRPGGGEGGRPGGAGTAGDRSGEGGSRPGGAAGEARRHLSVVQDAHHGGPAATAAAAAAVAAARQRVTVGDVAPRGCFNIAQIEDRAPDQDADQAPPAAGPTSRRGGGTAPIPPDSIDQSDGGEGPPVGRSREAAAAARGAVTPGGVAHHGGPVAQGGRSREPAAAARGAAPAGREAGGEPKDGRWCGGFHSQFAILKPDDGTQGSGIYLVAGMAEVWVGVRWRDPAGEERRE